MTVCVLDLETRSTRKLGKGGTNAYTYAADPTTDVWFVCFAFDDAPDDVMTWWPGEPVPDTLWQHVTHGGTVSAHNAAFEHAIWTEILTPRYAWPTIDLAQMDDTAARAARCGLPRSLEKAAPAAGLDVAKDETGSRLMKQMAKPRRVEADGTVVWWDVPSKIERLHAYGRQDVRVQMRLHRVLPYLPDREWHIWQATQRANAYGVMLDVPFIERAQAVVDRQLDAYARELQLLTHGQVSSHNDLNGMRAWLAGEGITVDSLNKQVVASLRADPDTPQRARRVLTIRAEAGKTSVAKFPAMREHVDGEYIARDQLVYYGAGPGRWSGFGIQLQNLPARGAVGFEDAEAAIDYMLRVRGVDDHIALLELLHEGSPIETLSMCLRGAIRARPGKVIVCADYSNIEGRINAWLAGEAWKLKAFRDFDDGHGADLYKVTAGLILGKDPDDVTKVERNILGKISELALGFQGGSGAYAQMGDNFGIDMADYFEPVSAALDPAFFDQAHENYETFGKRSPLPQRAWLVSEAIKLAWRDRHPGIQQGWRDSEAAAVAAIEAPGRVQTIAQERIAFLCREMFGKPFLLMRLPSGRCIHFANVGLRDQRTPWGAVKPQIWYDKVDQGRVVRSPTYGGDIWQSGVQGSARDVMADGWLGTEAAGYQGLFSVHDEMASEIEADRANLRHFEQLLCATGDWTAGCPITATGYIAQRFRKD